MPASGDPPLAVPIRWLLLAGGWVLFVVALLMPGIYADTGIVSSSYDTLPTWIVMLWVVFVIPGSVFERGGIFDLFHTYASRGWIVPATAFIILSMIVGVVLFLFSPFYMLLAPRFRFISRLRWLSPCLLAGWLLPFLGWLSKPNGRETFLYGYYLMASACTLVFVAILLTPTPPPKWRGHGFEPVIEP